MAHNYKITFGAELDISQMKGALNQLQQQLADLKFPASITKGVTETFSKLSDEIKNFEELRNKGVKSPADFAKLEASGEKIISLYEKLKKSAGDLSKLSGKDLEKLFPQSAVDTIEKARKALAAYEGEVKKAATKVDDLNKKIQAQQNLVAQAKAKKATAESAMPEAQTNLDQASKAIQDKTGISDTSAALQKLIEDYNKASEAAKKYEEAVARGESISPAQKGVITKKNNLEALIKTYVDAANKVKVVQDAINSAEGDINKGVGEIDKLNESLKKAQAEQDVAKSNALTSLLNSMKELDGIDMSKYDQSLEGAKQALEDFINANGAAAKGQIENFLNALEASGVNVDDLRKTLAALGQQLADTDARMKDVQALKSRIQYFFGLQNSINLVKRAIRGAFETIKELDKVMTETAVVTDFSVSDMWSQLPEYTKRANELGVTTKAAYEAATLYYQQGLKTNEVNALSVETLKMARIAGLDAAEATDRMTNALRGFNMELTEANAQRVDDVYSELAANTASNVDEISTAMTKVASLAHNANMEFETTAAFLAQIIETTRESAETAGTALKTVVARFSEVKKLVSEGQLTGTDEEGQAIDVNRVGAALRTAGIDLNKYFLNEIKLNDIFMELASKWDSLTSVQQRYIATQAAGSRQQSRFIAMVQDYARTQELVGKAYASSGASEKQFEKTQESLESKLNRLKNAWNEFLMGLTNNEVIKGVVDLLTDVLNTINKLTDAFGESGSSIAKWALAIGGLKAVGGLFKNGGLFDKVLSNSIFSGFLGKGAGATAAGGAKLKGLGGITKALLDFQDSKGIIDISGVFDKLGTSIKAALGSFKAFVVAAAPVLAVMAALAGYAYLANNMRKQEIEKMDPAATQKKQLELTKQNAEAMKEWTDRTEEQSRALKEIQSAQTGNLVNINEAQTTSEYREAIQAQNDYIKSLIEKDAQYSQYVQSIEGINGEIILTLDEEALAEACNLAAEAAVKSAAAGQFSQSAVASSSNAVLQANLEALQKKYYSVTDENGKTKYYRRNEAEAIHTENDDFYRPEITVEISEEEYRSITAQEQEIIAEQQKNSQQAQINATNAFSEMGWHLELDPSTIKTVSTALGSAFNADAYSQAILDSIAQQEAFYKNNNFSDAQKEADLRQKYYDTYGVQASNDLSISALMNALATYDQSTKQMQQTKDFADLINTDEAAKQMALAFTGQIEGQEELFTWGEDDVRALDPVAEKIRQALGLGVDDFVKKYQEAQTGVKNRKAHAKEQYYSAMGGAVTRDTYNQVQSLNLQDVEHLGSIAEQLKESISPDALMPLLETLPNMASEELEQVDQFLQTLNLENPIQALDQIQSKLAEVDANSSFGKILTSIQQTNSALFDTGNLVQYFVTTTDFSNMTESLNGFIEANGKITADNINELAKSNGALNKLLEQATKDTGSLEASSRGLAAVLTQYQQGNVGIEALSTSLIKALGNTRSVEEAMNHLHEFIKNFDKGLDYGEASDFFTGLYDDALELINNFEFGNPQLKNIYETFFGQGSYKAALDSVNGDLTEFEELIRQQLKDASDTIKNDSQAFMETLADILPNVTKKKVKGEIEFDWDIGDATTEDLITQIQEKYSEKKGIEISKEFAEGLLQGWLNHSPETAKILNENDFKAAVEAFATDTATSRAMTEEELKALAKAYGKTVDEVKDYIKQLQGSGQTVKFTIEVTDKDGNPLSGENILNQITEGLGGDQSLTDYLQQYLTGDGNIDANGILSGLMKDFNLSEEEAKKVAEAAAKQLGVALETSFKSVDANGNIVDSIVKDANYEDLTVRLNNAMQNVKADEFISALAAGEYQPITDAVKKAVVTGGENAATQVANSVKTKVEAIKPTLSIDADISGLDKTIRAYLGSQNFTASMNLYVKALAAAASGGVVGAYANGILLKSFAQGNTNKISPGFALTGEEGPEIVWNKEEGYSYITGANGPAFQNLKPGDQVFNAQDTSRILANTGQIKKFDSFAPGKYPIGHGGGSGGSSSKKDDSDDSIWNVDLDWLYDLMEDISEYERKQTLLQTRYEAALTDQTKTGRDLYNLTQKQLQNLYNQQRMQTEAYKRRSQEMETVEKEGTKHSAKVNGKNYKYSQLVDYNPDTQTIDIDWDKINNIKDEDQYNDILDYISRLETIQGQMDDAESALLDIENQIQDLKNRQLQAYADFQDRVLNAVIEERQAQIDSLSELNKTLNDANASILNSLQEEIAVQRQIRENTKTEENIADMEARLAYLQRDTTGANDTEIRQLQQQIAEARESYSDTLIDQSLDRLSQANDEAAKQRERQIELMQAQLDYDQKSGALWDEVNALIAAGVSSETGSLISGSTLETLLQNTEDWDAMSEAQRSIWANELITSVNQVGAYLIEQAEGLSATADAIDSLDRTHGTLGGTPASPRNDNTSKTRRPGKIDNYDDPLERDTGIGTDWQKLSRKPGLTATESTGVWGSKVSGTGSLVRNLVSNTDGFIKLADVASRALTSKENVINNAKTDNTFNISIDVDSISDDYDVDRLVDRIKEDLFTVASYRNVNAIGLTK